MKQVLNLTASLLALFAVPAFATASDASMAQRQELAAQQAALKGVYASEVRVSFANHADKKPASTGNFSVAKPVEGERPKREPLTAADKASDEAGLPLPLDLAAKPEYALPIGEKLEFVGTEACGPLQCNVFRSKGDLNGKGKVFFDARIRLVKDSSTPYDSAVTLAGIPFVDVYSYVVAFASGTDGLRLGKSVETIKGSMLFKKFDVERTQTFSAWRPR
jgi:hypothetical protein